MGQGAILGTRLLFSCHLYTIRHKLVQMHSVMKYLQALYVADYLSWKGLEFGLALVKITPIRHKSMLFIPDIWCIPQLFFSLQRQIDKNFE